MFLLIFKGDARWTSMSGPSKVWCEVEWLKE
jgi:hypothetical protein